MKSLRDETLHTYSVSLGVSHLSSTWGALSAAFCGCEEGGNPEIKLVSFQSLIDWIQHFFLLSPTVKSIASTEESNNYTPVSRSNCWRLRVLAVFCWLVLTSTWKSADVAFNRGSTSPFMSFPLCQVWFMSAPVCAAVCSPSVGVIHMESFLSSTFWSVCMYKAGSSGHHEAGTAPTR